VLEKGHDRRRACRPATQRLRALEGGQRQPLRLAGQVTFLQLVARGMRRYQPL
jgi:hypothetical protein